MNLIRDLNSICERCRSASEIRPRQIIQVKGNNLLLDVLKDNYTLLKFLSQRYGALQEIDESVRNWIAYLDKKYAERQQILGLPVYIDFKDAKELSQDTDKWMTLIINEYAKQRTVIIQEWTMERYLSNNILSSLDELTREDLNDAFSCIVHLLPTPAAMISLRAAENIVRRYYTKITGESAVDKTWGNILDCLKESQQVKSSLLGYLDYLRDKRNEAAHPDKRFGQEESERIFLHIKGLLDELED